LSTSIAERIAEGNSTSGKTAVVLVNQLGVSRLSVREALSNLRSMGSSCPATVPAATSNVGAVGFDPVTV
jgi:hypothetical protein